MRLFRCVEHRARQPWRRTHRSRQHVQARRHIRCPLLFHRRRDFSYAQDHRLCHRCGRLSGVRCMRQHEDLICVSECTLAEWMRRCASASLVFTALASMSSILDLIALQIVNALRCSPSSNVLMTYLHLPCTLLFAFLFFFIIFKQLKFI